MYIVVLVRRALPRWRNEKNIKTFLSKKSAFTEAMDYTIIIENEKNPDLRASEST